VTEGWGYNSYSREPQPNLSVTLARYTPPPATQKQFSASLSKRENEGRPGVADRLREFTWNLDTWEERYGMYVLQYIFRSFARSRLLLPLTKNQVNGETGV